MQEDLAAIDRSIGLYDETIAPGAIAPVNGWRGNYGKRGALKAAVVEVLEASAPNWVSTDAIESAIRAKFGLVFETPIVRSTGTTAASGTRSRHCQLWPRGAAAGP